MDDIDDILKEWKSDSSEAEESGFAETGLDPLEALVDDAWTEQGTSLTHIEEEKRKKRATVSSEKSGEEFADQTLEDSEFNPVAVPPNDGADSEIWGDLAEATESKDATTERTLEETDWGDGGGAKVEDESWSALAEEDTWGAENGVKDSSNDDGDSDIFEGASPEETRREPDPKTSSDPWAEEASSEPDPKNSSDPWEESAPSESKSADDSWGTSGDKAPSVEDSWGATGGATTASEQSAESDWGEDTASNTAAEESSNVAIPVPPKAKEPKTQEEKPENSQVWDELSPESAVTPTQLEEVLEALNNDPELNVEEDLNKKKKKLIEGPSLKDKICALPGLFLTLLIRLVSWPLSYLEAPLRPWLITKTGLTWYDWAGGFIMVQAIFVLVQCFFILII